MEETRNLICINCLAMQVSGWFHGVMVSTLDSESSDPCSNLGGTLYLFVLVADAFFFLSTS